jgi:hypothetical protein
MEKAATALTMAWYLMGRSLDDPVDQSVLNAGAGL